MLRLQRRHDRGESFTPRDDFAERWRSEDLCMKRSHPDTTLSIAARSHVRRHGQDLRHVANGAEQRCFCNRLLRSVVKPTFEATLVVVRFELDDVEEADLFAGESGEVWRFTRYRWRRSTKIRANGCRVVLANSCDELIASLFLSPRLRADSEPFEHLEDCLLPQLKLGGEIDDRDSFCGVCHAFLSAPPNGKDSFRKPASRETRLQDGS